MNTQKTIIKPRRKAIHNPRATAAAPCTCPACVRHRTAEGKTLAADYNGWARTKTHLFAVILSGDALAPRFNSGDTLAIDRDRKPQPGSAVLVSINGKAVCKAVMLINADGDALDLRGGYVPAGAFTIEGVVIARHAARKV